VESFGAALPGRLAVVLRNVRAVREVCDYIDGGDIQKDLEIARQGVVKHLSQSLPVRDGWRRPSPDGDGISLHPEKKWNVPSGEAIAISVLVPTPVAVGKDEDLDASVNLYVPSWKLRERFSDSLRPIVPKAKGWIHTSDEPDGFALGYPLGKWIRYADYARATGFDATGFLQAITDAVGELLQLEAEIDRLVERAKATSAALPRKRTADRTGRERKPR